MMLDWEVGGLMVMDDLEYRSVQLPSEQHRHSVVNVMVTRLQPTYVATEDLSYAVTVTANCCYYCSDYLGLAFCTRVTFEKKISSVSRNHMIIEPIFSIFKIQ